MTRPRLKVCTQPGCAEFTRSSRCTVHQREREQARGTRQQRGYDAAHDRLRMQLTPLVEAGGVLCWRCKQPIQPGTPWDLGHDDHDRSITRGPEHANQCNRAAGGRAAHTGG